MEIRHAAAEDHAEFGVKYILFEFSVEQAFSMIYVGDETVQRRWRGTG